jgi:membrane protease YdiL (CAAX protease family)
MAALMTLIMASLSIAFYYYQGNEIKFNRWDQEQALFALACFCIIIFQASAEELLFRGVIIQCLGKLTRNFWLLLIIPSLLFWAAHQGNSEVDEIGHAAQFFYIGFSLILTALTLLTGRLEYSIGMHIANNLFVFLLVNNTAYPITTNPIGLFEFSQKLNMPDLFITLGLFTITALLILSFAKIGRK